MKTKKFKFKQLLKLHLFKSRIYECSIKKTNFNDLITANLDQVIVDIKKALQIIFQYHQTNKRILFIGLPFKLELKINSLTRHTAIAHSFFIQGLISRSNANAVSSIQSPIYKSAKQSSTLLVSKFAKKPDLIVLFDHDKNFSILLEAWVAKIPVINFVDNDRYGDSPIQSLYSVNGNFKNILSVFDKNIFFIGLNFLFKNWKKKQNRFSSNLPKFNSKFSNENRKRSGRKKNFFNSR